MAAGHRLLSSPAFDNLPEGMSTIIAPEDLGSSYRRLDVRLGPRAAEEYLRGHLEGAHFVDVETDLCGDASDPSRGGRHPLPPLRSFAQTLGRLGIGSDTKVVVYDDAGGAMAAARAWWMLRAVGHERVWVLDGGLSAAVEAGHSLTSDTPTVMPFAPYPVQDWKPDPIAIEEVERIAGDPRWCVIDVRAEARFRGDSEPLDPLPGHIPGAINVPLEQNLDERGRFLSRGALRLLYASALRDAAMENVVVSCGSGVTACHTLLALDHAGLRGARLFVGSYSEWCRSGRPVERA